MRRGLRDLVHTKPQLIAENALLRQQLIVLNRSVKRPRLTNTDRSRLILLASRVPVWKDALLIIQPDTLLRWHRQGFRLFWRRKSRAPSRAPRIPATTITLIQEMTVTNRFAQGAPGVKRIQGVLLRLGINISKRTIQRYIRQVRPSRPHGQSWTTFLQNHAAFAGRARAGSSAVICGACGPVKRSRYASATAYSSSVIGSWSITRSPVRR